MKKEYLRSFYRGNRLLWCLVMGLSVLTALGNPLVSWLLKEAVDVIYTGDVAWLAMLVRIAAAMVVFMAVTDTLLYRLRARFCRRAMENYKALAFEKLAGKGISAFFRENTGRYLSILTNDLQTIETNYLLATFSLVQQTLMGLMCAGMLFWYGGTLAWLCVGFSLVPIGISVLMGGELTRRTKAVSDQEERYVAQLKDLLGGFGVIKSFKAEPQAQSLFCSASSKTERVKEKRRWWEALLSIAQEVCTIALQLGVVFAGGWLAIRGEMTAGTAVVLVNLCGQLLNPILSLPQAIAQWRAARGLIGKLADLMEENVAQTGEPIAPILKDSITFRDVSFGYEAGKPVLYDIDLTLEAGKRYAIVGASGSGKSTLLNLLMGGYGDYSGSITIDGKEINTVSPDSLYDLISLIGQNVFLFDNTIRENITMFRDFPTEAVDSAVERSGLANVIAAKGEGYRCGENGNGLSGGERQRVSIARSLLRGTQVLMLDEATAALDNQTAFEVTDAILKLDGLTRIVVTHRLEEKLLEQYDAIIVLKDGKITEQGTFGELMAKTGYFYSLYNVNN